MNIVDVPYILRYIHVYIYIYMYIYIYVYIYTHIYIYIYIYIDIFLVFLRFNILAVYRKTPHLHIHDVLIY